MENDRFPRYAFQHKPKGRTDIGRPFKRWLWSQNRFDRNSWREVGVHISLGHICEETV